MKDIICVNIFKNHIYDCATSRIGIKGENLSTCFEITLDNELLGLDLFMEFLKPTGESLVTPKLELINNVATYDVPLYLLDTTGYLKAQIVLRDTTTGKVWKTYTKEYYIVDGICACDDIPNKEDWITHAESVLTQIENGLTPTIGENGNWFILDKDTGKPSRGPKGDASELSDEDIEKIETNVKTDMQPILEDIENIAKQAENIARGRATGYVFDTLQDLELWLQNSENISNLVLGDNFYIRATDVPDYWWDGTQKQQLEAEKPILTGFVKEEDLETKVKAIGDGYYATEEYVTNLIGDIEQELGGI